MKLQRQNNISTNFIRAMRLELVKKKIKKKQEQIKKIFRLTSFKPENYNNIDLYFF